MRNLLLAVMLIAVLTQGSAGTKAAWGFGTPSTFSYYTVDQCTAQAKICHPKGAKGPKDLNMDACMNVCKDCREHFSALDQAVAGGQSGAVAGLCQKVMQFARPCVKEAQACMMSINKVRATKGRLPKTPSERQECDLFCNKCKSEFAGLQEMMMPHRAGQGQRPRQNMFKLTCQRLGMGAAAAPGSVAACTNDFIKCSTTINSWRKENPTATSYPVDSPPFAPCRDFCETSDPAPANGGCNDEKKSIVARTIGFPPAPRGLEMIKQFCKNLFHQSSL